MHVFYTPTYNRKPSCPKKKLLTQSAYCGCKQATR